MARYARRRNGRRGSRRRTYRRRGVRRSVRGRGRRGGMGLSRAKAIVKRYQAKRRIWSILARGQDPVTYTRPGITAKGGIRFGIASKWLKPFQRYKRAVLKKDGVFKQEGPVNAPAVAAASGGAGVKRARSEVYESQLASLGPSQFL